MRALSLPPSILPTVPRSDDDTGRGFYLTRAGLLAWIGGGGEIALSSAPRWHPSAPETLAGAFSLVSHQLLKANLANAKCKFRRVHCSASSDFLATRPEKAP